MKGVLTPVEFRATAPDQLDRLIAFLRSTFGAGEQDFARSLMRWKLFDPRPDWPGPRSCLLVQGDEIIGHCGFLPIRLLTPKGRILCLHTHDWASTRPGAGLQMFQRIYPMCDVHLVIGGNRATMEILARLRYRQAAELKVYGRVVRPFRAIVRKAAAFRLKKVLVLAREAALTWRRLPPAPSQWTAEEVPRFQAAAAPPVPDRPRRSAIVVERSVELLNYMLACPAGPTRGFELWRSGRRAGYFLVIRIGSQARIVDLFVDSDKQEDWDSAFALAVRAAARDERVFDVTGASSAGVMQESMRRTGFRLRDRTPVWVRDPKDLLDGLPLLNLNFIDGDLAYL